MGCGLRPIRSKCTSMATVFIVTDYIFVIVEAYVFILSVKSLRLSWRLHVRMRQCSSTLEPKYKAYCADNQNNGNESSMY